LLPEQLDDFPFIISEVFVTRLPSQKQLLPEEPLPPLEEPDTILDE
jgi:hypothetical protein